MDSVSAAAEATSRPKRPLPSNSASSFVERKPISSTGSSDLGGTLVPHTVDDTAELSTDSDDDEGTNGTSGSGSKRRKGKGKSNLPRRQIKIEYIQDKSRRNITFGKRKNGIFKKAQEISTLTGCEVMLIVASKDSDLQAFTYATSRLRPLVTEPAGEAYIQNCLRYGALIPGTPSGMTAAYGATGSQGSHISTINTGPRTSVPSNNISSHNSMYPYAHSTQAPRRGPAYGVSNTMTSSPQSASSVLIASQPQQSVSFPDEIKKEQPHSPAPRLSTGVPAPCPKSPWSLATPNSIPDFHASASNFGTSESVNGSSHREILAEWGVPANPRSLFQTSPSLGAAPVSRGLSPFPIVSSSSGNTVCYSNNPSLNSPFHRQSPDSSIVHSSPWQSLPNHLQGIRQTPGTPVSTTSAVNTNVGNHGSGFLEPLVLSQPYEHRSVSSVGDGPRSAGPSNTTGSNRMNIQSSMSAYADCETYDSICHPNGYTNDEGSENETRPYQIEPSDHPWSGGIH